MAQVNFLSREKFGARKDLLPAAKGWNIESLGARRERNVTRIFLLRSFLPLSSAIFTYEHRVWIAMALVIRASTYSYLTLWQLVPPSLLVIERERRRRGWFIDRWAEIRLMDLEPSWWKDFAAGGFLSFSLLSLHSVRIHLFILSSLASSNTLLIRYHIIRYDSFFG